MLFAWYIRIRCTRNETSILVATVPMAEMGKIGIMQIKIKSLIFWCLNFKFTCNF